MKISKKEANLLIGFLGILIAFCAYQFGYVKLNALTEEKAAENAKMRKEIAVLQELEANKTQYVTDTEDMKTDIALTLTEFPSGILPEDDIKHAYQQDNKNPDEYVYINSMSFGDNEVMYTTNQNTVSADNITVNGVQLTGVELEGNMYPTYILYRMQTSYGLDVGYNGLKNVIKSVYDAAGKKSVDSVSVAFDENTGRLTGSVIMNSFYVTGTDVPYEQPVLVPVRQGTDDIFATVKAREEAEAEAQGASN